MYIPGTRYLAGSSSDFAAGAGPGRDISPGGEGELSWHRDLLHCTGWLQVSYRRKPSRYVMMATWIEGWRSMTLSVPSYYMLPCYAKTDIRILSPWNLCPQLVVHCYWAGSMPSKFCPLDSDEVCPPVRSKMGWDL